MCLQHANSHPPALQPVPSVKQQAYTGAACCCEQFRAVSCAPRRGGRLAAPARAGGANRGVP
eukprot:1776333-Alexandrium_andersonii.AAC.1